MKFHSEIVVDCAEGIRITYRNANVVVEDGVLKVHQLVDGSNCVTALLNPQFWHRTILVKL